MPPIPVSNEPHWGKVTLDELLKQVEARIRMVWANQQYGSVTITLVPGKADLRVENNTRYVEESTCR
jgi:hypothetical protein